MVHDDKSSSQRVMHSCILEQISSQNSAQIVYTIEIEHPVAKYCTETKDSFAKHFRETEDCIAKHAT